MIAKGSGLDRMKKILKRIEYTLYIFIFILAVIFTISVMQNGLSASLHSIQSFIDRTGVWGWILFVLLQILQVVIPFIPGGVINTIGVILYGP